MKCYQCKKEIQYGQGYVPSELGRRHVICPAGQAVAGAAICSAAILDYPNEAGWWWAWTDNAKRWYLINISPEDLNNDPELDNVPTSYAWWTKCVPPLPPNGTS